MTHPAVDLARHLALNLASLRMAHGLSQDALARKAGIPRSTVTHAESGSANPSLSNLSALAAALGVGLDELVSEPRSEDRLIRAAEIACHSRAGGRARMLKLLPERSHGLEIDRVQLDPRSSFKGTPHVLGTREYLHGLCGELEVLVSGRLHRVGAGDVLSFAGDQPHSYRNGGDALAEAISVVVPLPARLGVPVEPR